MLELRTVGQGVKSMRCLLESCGSHLKHSRHHPLCPLNKNRSTLDFKDVYSRIMQTIKKSIKSIIPKPNNYPKSIYIGMLLLLQYNTKNLINIIAKVTFASV
jgi:hypothetical protein